MNRPNSRWHIGLACLALGLLAGCTGDESQTVAGTGGSVPTACSTEGELEYCYAGPAAARGVGECNDGTRTCEGGNWTECEGSGLPVAEVCDDYLDNNCNGVDDEGCACDAGSIRSCYTGPGTTRGIGVCADGEQACSGGVWDSACVGQMLPTDSEPCNEVDDNCNGVVDDGCSCTEGASRPCFSGPPAARGVGECNDGVQNCVGGEWNVTCEGEIVPGPEQCNGRDDDCDGQQDEEMDTTNCGLGPCAHTVENCINGVPQSCDPLEGATTETCDGQDNDCDGSTDEGCNCINGTTQPCYTGAAGTQNVGPCHGGTQTCTNGAYGSCNGQVTPVNETCNGTDDDCDGSTDEGLGSTNCGVGDCAHTQQNCVGGQPRSCDPYLGASSESCNGDDDDCDGSTDEGLGSTNCGLGECAHTQQNCVNGSPVSCNPMQGASTETCDGKDNDCDGPVDENPSLLCDTANDFYCYGVQGCVWNGTCPFLYAWDGTEFGFEADLYGSGKLGVENSSGFVMPHPEDYHVLYHEPALLDGSIELRLVEERSEVNYFDLATLVAAYVPDTLELYPELHAVGSAYRSLEESLHTIAVGTVAPVSAVHLNASVSILEEITASDQNFAVLNEDRNMMDYQTVELDLGNLSGAPQIKLLIDARTAFANSPEGKARRAQFGARTKLEVLDAGGQWVEVPKSVATLFPPKEVRRPYVLDLTNAFLTDDYRVRFTFLYKTYIDSIAVDTTADVPPILASTLLESAELSYYGHSLRVGTELFELVYGSVEQNVRPAFPGAYTRYGDVTELLGVADDKHVIYWAGDQVKLRFAPADPAPPGMRRFYILQAKGYYKDVTFRLAHTVEPLPFAAMSRYPYDILAERYPNDPEHVTYRQVYNTRWLP